MRDTDKEHRHPSYGMVQFNRRSNSNGSYLFGSSVTEHYHTVSLKIAHGLAIEDEHGEQRYRACGPIVEVELSAAQFAEAITTMNVGDGVPCTLSRLLGKIVEDPPKPKTDVERSHAAFEEKMGEFGRRVDKLIVVVEKATEAKGLSVAARKEIRDAVRMVHQEVSDNIPFYLRLFTEAAEKIVSVKKAEAEGWLTHALHKAGIEHVRALRPAVTDDADLPVLTTGNVCPRREEPGRLHQGDQS